MLRMVFRPTALPSTPTLTINSNTVNAWLNMLLIGDFSTRSFYYLLWVTCNPDMLRIPFLIKIPVAYTLQRST